MSARDLAHTNTVLFVPAYDDPLPRVFWVGLTVGVGLSVVAAVLGIVGAAVDHDLHAAAYFLMTPFSALGIVSIPLLGREYRRRQDVDSRR